mmetsp:Transcript_39654/g.107218  ORF Transcript_39654/g.107218 Transcript_39654/m.107218 type:complete len:351 (+) Transcript_39654:598-1650(+)
MEKVHEAAVGHLGLERQRLSISVFDHLVWPQPTELPRAQGHDQLHRDILETPLFCQRLRPLAPPALRIAKAQAGGVILAGPPGRRGADDSASPVEEEETAHREETFERSAVLHGGQGVPIVHGIDIALHAFPLCHGVRPRKLLRLRRHPDSLSPSQVVVHGVQGGDLARNEGGACPKPVALQDASLHLPIEVCTEVLRELWQHEVLRFEGRRHHREGPELLREDFPIHDEEDGHPGRQLRELRADEVQEGAPGLHLSACEHQGLTLPVHTYLLLNGLGQVRSCPVAGHGVALTPRDIDPLAVVAALHPHNHGLACGWEGGVNLLGRAITHGLKLSALRIFRAYDYEACGP